MSFGHAAPENQWASVDTPAPGPPKSIGDYSNGCVQGSKTLPLLGRGYQVAKPSRNRHFGHPQLVDFVQELGQTIDKKNWGPLLIGDLGQIRGGPAPSGHKSHQTGLDVDILFWHPHANMKAPKKGSHEIKDVESLEHHRIIDLPGGEANAYFGKRIDSILRHAALDERVDRIFVNPHIKQTLCSRAEKSSDTEWLRKIRPWWGHDSHFHVRLKCPKSSSHCRSQASLPEGDGCSALSWWFDERAQKKRAKNRARYRKGMGKTDGLPKLCNRLISNGPPDSSSPLKTNSSQ